MELLGYVLAFFQQPQSTVFVCAGITYLMTCSTALTRMYLRKSLRHFSSYVHSSQTDFI